MPLCKFPEEASYAGSGDVNQAAKNADLKKISLDEKTFRWMLNEDAMATEKLSSVVDSRSRSSLVERVIAIAWLWYRPLVSIIVIAVGLAAAFGLRTLAARKAAAAAPRAAPAA